MPGASAPPTELAGDPARRIGMSIRSLRVPPMDRGETLSLLLYGTNQLISRPVLSPFNRLD